MEATVMNHLNIKIYSTFISTIIISLILAFNYVYPNFQNLSNSMFGYSIYVFLLFTLGALISFILDYKLRNNFFKFTSYIVSGSFILLMFYLIDAQEIIFRDLYSKILLGAVCATLFFIIQETFNYIQNKYK